MRVLVTGGAGYIGSHAARELARQGCEVVLYDNLSTGHRFLADGFDLIEADIKDRQRLTAALGGVDAVMHFAAYSCAGESVSNPRKYFDNNVQSGLQFLDTVIDAGVRNFVFSSSCAVYGIPPRTPISEDFAREPVNPYGVSKLFFEQALEWYGAAYGLRYALLRYFNAAGADASGQIGEFHHPETHLIPLALMAAGGTRPEMEIFGSDYPTPDGTCVRDYINITDLVEAHFLALEYLINKGKSVTVNLGTGKGYSVLEILSMVESVTGLTLKKRLSPRRAGDPPQLVADSSLASDLLQWSPRRTLRDSVATAWKWMRSGKAPHGSPGS